MDSQKDSLDSLLTRIDRLSRRARAHLLWERYAPVLALGVAGLLIYMAGSFAGVWQRIGDPWRALALLAMLALLVRAIWRARTLVLPSQSEARRRVERDSLLEHRPFDTVRDRAANMASTDTALWDRHSQDAARAAASASPSRLRAVLAPIDSLYLRFAIPAVLLLTLMVGAGDSLERLRASFMPTWQSGMDGQNAKFDAWFDPPDYTGRPPVYFKGQTRLPAPEGSELVLRLSGLKDAPRLKLTQGSRSQWLTPSRLGPQSFEVRAIITDDAKASWRVGQTQKIWQLDMNEDMPPQVEWATPPAAGTRDQLTFEYSLSDDYGVSALELELTLLDEIDETPTDESERIVVGLTSESVRLAEAVDVQMNLTKHKWAGRKTHARLVATDSNGQYGFSAFEELIVPDRIFIEPLAKAIVENRRLLLAAGDTPYAPVPSIDPRSWPAWSADMPELRIDRAPKQVRRAAVLIDAITDVPAGAYKDPVVFMGLKNVQSRIEQAREIEDLHDAPEDLWLIAMRTEFGPLGNALEAMKAAEAALNDGIARRARKREVDTLFERYNDAVDRYMEYLFEQAKEAGTQEGGEGGGGEGRNVDEIQALLDAIEEANRLGDTEGARIALAQLAELLENMQIQLTEGGGGEGGEGSPSDGLSDEVKDALEDLADTLGKQREINDETEQAERAQEEEQEEAERQILEDGEGEDDGAAGSAQGEQGEQGSEAGAPDAEQLARDQAALQAAIDALEQALIDGGTDLDAVPGQDAEQSAQQSAGEGEGAGAGEQDGEQAGGGGEQEGQQAGGGSGQDGDPQALGGGAGGSQQAENGERGLSPSEALDAARRAMEESQQALGGEDFAAASDAQRDAIAALREAAESLISQANINGDGEQGSDGQSAEGNDPFGREGENGQATGDDVKLPGESERQRARDLMEELRERAGDQQRGQEELNYLERLLERF